MAAIIRELNRGTMVKKITIFLAGLLMWSFPLWGSTEGPVFPYQDYQFILIHGINDYRKSFDGTSPELDPATQERTNIVKLLKSLESKTDTFTIIRTHNAGETTYTTL